MDPPPAAKADRRQKLGLESMPNNRTSISSPIFRVGMTPTGPGIVLMAEAIISRLGRDWKLGDALDPLVLRHCEGVCLRKSMQSHPQDREPTPRCVLFSLATASLSSCRRLLRLTASLRSWVPYQLDVLRKFCTFIVQALARLDWAPVSAACAASPIASLTQDAITMQDASNTAAARILQQQSRPCN